MRTYPTNSPHSAARIVALTLVSDGQVSDAELDVLSRADAYQQLGITRRAMRRVLKDLCDDLLQGHRSQLTDAGLIDPRTLGQLLAEIGAALPRLDEPKLVSQSPARRSRWPESR